MGEVRLFRNDRKKSKSVSTCQTGGNKMQNYTTQMDAARKGIVTKEMEIVAQKH